MRPLARLLLPVVLLAAGPLGADEAPGLPPDRLPPGTVAEDPQTVPEEAAQGVAGRLGVEIERLVVQDLSLGGFPARVNVVTAPSEAAAEAVLGAMLRIRGPEYVTRRGRDVVEVVGTNPLVAAPILGALEPTPRHATWRIRFRVALVASHDPMEANPVFVLFLRREAEGPSEAVDEEIRRRVEGWRFGRRLRLLRRTPEGEEVRLRLDPEPARTTPVGDEVELEFEDPPQVLGIPYVDVEAVVPVTARWTPSGAAAAEDPAGATAWWPAAEPGLDALVARLAPSGRPPTERLLALLRAVATEIAYGGPMGSRKGVSETLRTKQGRCWDKSDVLVTLARAAGLPAREIVGWVPPLDAGHVWTEVHLPGAGWIPVDATCTWLGTSEAYIPLFRTADGDLPVVHLRRPEIERLPE